MEEFSCLVFHTLDCIGYCQEIVTVRRNFWSEFRNEVNSHNDGFRYIMAGSKAEGITSLYESDIDFMTLFNNVICTDNVEPLSRLPHLTVIHADTREAPPGYTRLKLISRNDAFSRQVLKECSFESESRDVYLSSSLFTYYIKSSSRQHPIREHYNGISGPALQCFTSKTHMSFDGVFAFSCYFPHLLNNWKSRPRLYHWPPADVQEEAASMLAQVVPVGSKGSCDQWREWRFCFIESELKLTYSLNETQLKLYIVLKMVAKEILCHVSTEISSYIMKNITFWLSELLPEVVFRKGNFLSLLLLSLRFLQSSINKWNWLPYYMIPGRNLLAERLTPDNRRQLSDLIETLIQEGPQLILRCTKLRTAVYVRLAVPDLIVKYGETRHLVEMLQYCRLLLKLHNADESDIRAIDRKTCDIVLPEWRMLVHLGSPTESINAVISERVRALLW